MWNQSQPLQPNWGWPPNPNYQFNNSQDESQSWAAAAALWVQHKQFHPNGNEGYAILDKPPEPPGPPPLPPPLPPPEEVPAPVEVVDYNHGQTILENQPEAFQNDLSKQESSKPLILPGDVFDYNHGKAEANGTEQNWGYNMWAGQQVPAQPVPGFYNSDWNQGQWNGEHWESWNDSTSNFHPQPEGFDQNSFHPPVFQDASSKHKEILYNGRSENNSPDPIELAKKGKSLPLWLRQGLEKLGKDKEKQKVKEDLPVAKKISGYQHGSPHSSPEREEQINIAENPKASTQEESVPIIAAEDDASPHNKVEEELDEEEKQRRRMLKIKTWMTETLLGVTNDEIQSLCNEVYFEIKRSVKVKATQLRKSGGLEALRSAALGDGDPSASDSEEEPPSPKKILVETTKSSDVSHTSPVPTKTFDMPAKSVYSERREEQLQAEIKSLDILIQARKQQKINAEKNIESQRHKETDSYSVKKSLNNKKTSDSDESTSNLRKKRKQFSESSSSEDESEESDCSDSDSVSRKRKKPKHRPRSPSKHKRTKKKNKRQESSSESDHKKKKRKKKDPSSSSDESLHSLRKKKSKGKKHKHKSRSHSRSPRYSKQRR